MGNWKRQHQRLENITSGGRREHNVDLLMDGRNSELCLHLVLECVELMQRSVKNRVRFCRFIDSEP
jgi:hypothetical protein